MHTNLAMPLKDELCPDQEGHYYNLYYVGNLQEVAIHQQYIGKVAVSAKEALVRADEELAKHQTESLFACAASVLRLCLGHEEPRIELVENAITIAPGSSRYTIPGIFAPGNGRQLSGGVRFFSFPEYGNALYRLTDQNGMVGATYLPREDYAGVRYDHEGVMAYRGGHTYPVLFGVLGDEKLVDMPVAPNMRSEYY
ncbi:MAG TPA: hypothetical protein V6C72_17355 [Chroococcales cyanobacterium]